jgi:histidinol-phosphate/aromatic aminotransferase/cobyric acid decarboxylase-like protein
VAWVAPAFGEYAQAARASGAAATAIAQLADLGAGAADLVFVARPGNPTLARPAIAPLPRALLVVDEAYQPLCDELAPIRPSDGVAVLRSLTKIFALPGLRLGYLLASPSVARAVQASLPPWNVSQPAIAAGLAAIAEPTAPVRAAVRALRLRLCDGLRRRGARVVATDGTFVVVDVGDAARATALLGQGGVRVRDCSSFGLPSLVRIGVGDERAQDRLLAAWGALA